MSIQSEINRISNNIASAFAIVEEETGTALGGANSDELPYAVGLLLSCDIDGGLFTDTNTASDVDGGTF